MLASSDSIETPSVKKIKVDANLAAAAQLKAELSSKPMLVEKEDVKVKQEDINVKVEESAMTVKVEETSYAGEVTSQEEEEEEEEEKPEPVLSISDEKSKTIFKEAVKKAEQERLDEFSRNVVDSVRLHETGYKERYYR